MDSRLLGRRIAAISGVTAFIAMGGLTAACAKEEQKAPETTTTTTTTATTTSPPAPAGTPARRRRALTRRAETCSRRQLWRPRRQLSLPASIPVSTGFRKSLDRGV